MEDGGAWEEEDGRAVHVQRPTLEQTRGRHCLSGRSVDCRGYLKKVRLNYCGNKEWPLNSKQARELAIGRSIMSRDASGWCFGNKLEAPSFASWPIPTNGNCQGPHSDGFAH